MVERAWMLEIEEQLKRLMWGKLLITVEGGRIVHIKPEARLQSPEESREYRGFD